MTISVMFGDHHTGQLDEPEQKRKVVAVIVHKQFVLRNDYCNNDVALLKLDKPIEMSAHIDAACLPPKKLHLKPGTRCMALGWGVVQVSERRTSFLDWFRPPQMIRASVLQEVSLPLVSYQDCLRHFPSYSITRDRHLCAGERGKDTCKGDSGGPLMCEVETQDEKKRWFLYGITSFGSRVKCGGSYGVYSRVSEFSEWMKKSMESVWCIDAVVKQTRIFLTLTSPQLAQNCIYSMLGNWDSWIKQISTSAFILIQMYCESFEIRDFFWLFCINSNISKKTQGIKGQRLARELNFFNFLNVLRSDNWSFCLVIASSSKKIKELTHNNESCFCGKISKNHQNRWGMKNKREIVTDGTTETIGL